MILSTNNIGVRVKLINNTSLSQFSENAPSQNIGEGSLQLQIGKECCCESKHPLTSENGCIGDKTEPGYDKTSQDWNEEIIGSLLDDDIDTSATNNQSKENNDLEKNNSVNNERKNKEGNKTHRPKRLHHHLSWQNALKKAQCMPDPWEKFHIDDSCPTEVAIRHRYNALKKNWVKDEVTIKMEALVSFRLSLFG